MGASFLAIERTPHYCANKRGVFLVSVLIFSFSVVFLTACARVTHPTAFTNVRLAPDRESELISTLERYASTQELVLKGSPTHDWRIRAQSCG